MQFYWNEFTQEINNEIFQNAVVFDAGAGDGHWKHNLKQNIKYIGMDLGVGDKNVDYSHLDIKGDLRSIPMNDNSVDIIICIQVLEHLPEPWKVIHELHRILKPGGFMFVSCPQGEPQHQVPYDFFRYTIFGLDALLKSHGFTVEWIKPQRGDFSKIANDLRHSGNAILTTKAAPRLMGWLLKLSARVFELVFRRFDDRFTTNAIGHFSKARKP